MKFTVKHLFDTLAMQQQDLLKHRTYFGCHLRDLFKSTTGVPEKVEEEGVQVYHYPSEFRPQAEHLMQWYTEKYINRKVQPLPVTNTINSIEDKPALPKKRKRIVMPAYTTSK
jgi:hypothetical protein